MYKNVLFDDYLFSSFLVSCEPEVSATKLIDECYKIKNKFSSKNISNRNGYHSPNFSNKNPCLEEEYPELYKLEGIFLQLSTDYLESKDYKVSLGEFEWWININPPNSYNILHNHKRADVIGVYYLQCDDQDAQLSVLRNDGSQYGNLYSNKNDELKLNIPAVCGRLFLMPGYLFHYVSTNYEETDRISIAFNLMVYPK